MFQADLDKLNTCHPDLVKVFTALDQKGVLFKVLCGHRGEQEQNDAYAKGYSKLPWPKSKHNATPSLACDVAPLPLDWLNLGAFKQLSEQIKRTAQEVGVSLTWGGDWQNFKDYPHWQVG